MKPVEGSQTYINPENSYSSHQVRKAIYINNRLLVYFEDFIQERNNVELISIDRSTRSWRRKYIMHTPNMPYRLWLSIVSFRMRLPLMTVFNQHPQEDPTKNKDISGALSCLLGFL